LLTRIDAKLLGAPVTVNVCPMDADQLGEAADREQAVAAIGLADGLEAIAVLS
jgi:hypothetical protein